MKHLFTLLSLLAIQGLYAQQNISSFFSGTWKVEGKELYEHWDRLSDDHLKGFSYGFSEGKGISTIEYIDLKATNGKLIFEANVIGQNDGKAIQFEGSSGKDYYIFLNPEHDFPKKILYKKFSEDTMHVAIGAGGKEYTFNMIRQVTTGNPTSTAIVDTTYDEALAQKLNADERGMKSYFFVVLKTGTNQTKDKNLINESFTGHMANINRLVNEDKLIVAGPFGKNQDNYRGLFIFHNVANESELEIILKTDPAIKNSLLDFKIYPWCGSAALPMYLPFSKKISR